MCFSFRRDTERDASAIQRCKANQDVVMRKVRGIGSGGAGKSTFAAKLSRRTRSASDSSRLALLETRLD